MRQCASYVVTLLSVVVLVVAGLAPPALARNGNPPASVIAFEELPHEARHTVGLVRNGGPFPYSRDGIVFGNFERILPLRSRGYYHEYTVKTPGLTHRGARRIITGRQGELYYTEDHYRSFKRVQR